MFKLRKTLNKEDFVDREYKVAYLAGVMDSDGYFTIHRDTITPRVVNPIYSPSMGINQATPEAIQLFQELYGGKIGIIDYSKTENRFSRKPLYTWTVSKLRQLEFLTDIRPHLRIKKEQCNVIIALRKHIDTYRTYKNRGSRRLSAKMVQYRENLYWQLKALRGKNSLVAETERSGSQKRDTTVRSAQMENVQSSPEMREPAVIG